MMNGICRKCKNWLPLAAVKVNFASFWFLFCIINHLIYSDKIQISKQLRSQFVPEILETKGNYFIKKVMQKLFQSEEVLVISK